MYISKLLRPSLVETMKHARFHESMANVDRAKGHLPLALGFIGTFILTCWSACTRFAHPVYRRSHMVPGVLLWRMLHCIYRGVAFFSIACLLSCCSAPLIKYGDRDPPAVLSPLGAKSIIDGRVRFREILCTVTEARKDLYPDWRPCPEILLDFAEPESTSARGPILLGPPNPMKVVIVTGIFGECISDHLLPFSDGDYYEGYRPETDGYSYLHRLGYDDLEVIVTPGRSSTAANGRFVHEKLQAMTGATSRDIVVVAYSKGVTDTLHALVLFSEVPRNLRALVSIAGVVAGTPIADKYAGTYETLLEKVPYRDCPPGDGGGVRSLSRKEQFAWLSRNRLPESVRYYSLAASVPPERTASALKPFHAVLSHIDPRNDGQVLIQDAVIPGSTLLGYLNGDHWAVTTAFNRSGHPFWRRLVGHNAFPREVLIESILRYVAEDM